jgi:four helix bundle protein
MRDFRQLKVWEQSHRLTLKIYQLTKDFPKEELYSLTNQIRRSSYSIPTNIAEGCGRGSNKEFAHFLQIAVGSAYELDYQILLAKDLQYIDNVSYLELSNEVGSLQRQISALLRKVREAEH